MKILLTIWIILALAYCITWNKYYIPRHQEGKKTTFAGYLQWLKITYLHASEDEYK